MKRYLYPLIFLLLLANILFAQDSFNQDEIDQQSFNRSLIINQEIYLPGERINFTLLRKHMVKKPMKVTCRLVDFSGKNLKKKSFENISGRINGKIEIPADLDPGIYILICNDQNKRIVGYSEFILSLPNADKFNPEITFSKEKYQAGDLIQADFALYPKGKKDFGSARVKAKLVTLEDRIETERFRVKPGTHNEFSYRLEDPVVADLYLKGEIKIDSKKYPFFKKVPYVKQQFSMDAFVEGNVLKYHTSNKVALRVYSSLGEPFSNTLVKLLNSSNELIAEKQTDPMGHALFEFIPEKGENYNIQLPASKFFNADRTLKFVEGTQKIQVVRFNPKNAKLEVTGEPSASLLEFHDNKVSQRGNGEQNLEFKHNQYAHLLLRNQENELLSDLLFLNHFNILNSKIKNQEDHFEVNLLRNDTIIEDQPLVAGVFHQNRFSRYVNWSQYRLDYYFYPSYQKLFSNLQLSEPSDWIKLRLLLAPFKRNMSDRSQLIEQMEKEYPESKRELLIQNLKRNNALIYADGSVEPPEVKRIPEYKKRLANGVEVLEVLRSIKSYRIYNGMIIFPGMQNSFNIQQGALIVIDGVKAGTDISILQNLNPYDVKSIETLTDPNETLVYSGFANSGVIKIETKKGVRKQKEEKKEKKALDSELLWNVNVPFLKDNTTRILVPKNRQKGSFIAFAFGYSKSGCPIIFTEMLTYE